MNRSPTIASLASALAKAQAKLKNPHFDSTNPHFKSKFASLAAVREAVIPVLSQHGLSLSQWPVSNGNYAGCVTLLAHDSGEWLEETFTIPIDKANAHGYASAVTYAKRISMQSVASVVGDEDDDGNAAVESKPVSQISGAALNKEAYDSLEEDEKAWIDDLAYRVTKLVNAGDFSGACMERDIAIPHAENRHPKYVEYMNALSHRLESGIKTKLNKYRESLKKEAA